MESGKIPNARLTSSSAYNARYTAPNGRLHKAFCWIARHNNHNQWFKVDFGRLTTIRKIGTQGRRDANQWVTRYKLTYSVDTLHWATYRERSQDKVSLSLFLLFGGLSGFHERRNDANKDIVLHSPWIRAWRTDRVQEQRAQGQRSNYLFLLVFGRKYLCLLLFTWHKLLLFLKWRDTVPVYS